MNEKRLQTLHRQHQEEDRQRSQERREEDMIYTRRLTDIDRESVRRAGQRERRADRQHGSFEEAFEAKLSEAGRALVDRLQEIQARRELEERIRERDERRELEDRLREMERREQYQREGIRVDRTPGIDETSTRYDQRQRYSAEHEGSQSYGRTPREAVENLAIVQQEASEIRRDQEAISEARRRFHEEQQRDR